ncbi:IS3 family transposase [Pseudomonas sp. Marseille-P9655]|uniref:IS3 family transposase n=1 Tax=Pseudomonas sp. Marseille-P9655 TaxID=2866591 RepID=UPI00298F2BCE|nr:IS3 family transposase [Pseudomonas sp. Marseille-P9655]
MARQVVVARNGGCFQPDAFQPDRHMGSAVLQWRYQSSDSREQGTAKRHDQTIHPTRQHLAQVRGRTLVRRTAGQAASRRDGDRLPRKVKRTARGEGETEEGREEKVLIISALRTRFPLDGLLKPAGLARSTYYYQRKLMAAGDKLAALKDRIREIQQRHKGRYGYRRMTATLHSVGHAVNSKVVRRLMAELDLKCTVRVKKYKSYRGEPGRIAPNKMERKFTAEEPNRRWVTDVTEFKVAGEKLYLSPVLDLFNGEIVAHQIDTSPHYPLVGQMLKQALSRLPEGARPMLHSDQGWQYQYYRYRNRLEEMGLEQSMSRKGNCLDNARMESFFGTLKTEMYHAQRFASIEDLSAAIDEYIDYYNHDRIKMGLAGLSPVAYRNQAAAA